ncbi:hypothetical protein CL658_03690 [bacterium]|nr:hypothetical protein [bacterium]|tara:strand:- start:1702 stop:2202 length:501 start_codon:yes stop_codon:yes gene_type:complete
MLKKIIIFSLLINLIGYTQLTAEDTKDMSVYQTDKHKNQNGYHNLNKPVLFYQGEMIKIDFKILKEELGLTKKQVKKISSKYNKYTRKQLKVKEKIVGKKVKLSRLMMNGYYENYDFDDTINTIFSKKKKMFRNSVLFIKEIEDKLKKEQIVLFRQLVPELYNPAL